MLHDEKPVRAISVAMVGDSAVGKSTIVHTIHYKEIQQASCTTIGVNIAVCDIETTERRYHMKIFDTAGQEKYRSIAPVYYRNAHGIMFVYDVTNKDTLYNLAVRGVGATIAVVVVAIVVF